MTGVLMISLALVADAVIGNVQEKTIKQYNASNSEVAEIVVIVLNTLTFTFQVVLFSYSIGFVYLFFLVAVFTDIASAIHYCSYYPKQTYGYAFIFSLTGYLGIQVKPKLSNYFFKMSCLDCSQPRQTIWSFHGCHCHNFPEGHQYRSLLHLLLQALYFPLYLQVTLLSRLDYFIIIFFISGLLVLIGIYLSLYSKNKDSSSVAVFNNMFKKIKRLLFVPKFHTGKQSYNI